MDLEYTTVKEMIKCLESFFRSEQEVVDCYIENKNCVMVVSSGVKVRMRMPN